ncbi:MAG: hypothetical protein ACR2QF_00690 [Geminicoccaceae bacterium]
MDELGLDDIDISTVERLGAVSPKAIEQLQKIGNALADKIDLADFGAFAPSP